MARHVRMAFRRVRPVLDLAGALLGLVSIPFLPRGAVVALAHGLGMAGYVLARRERRIGLANLDVAYGGELTKARKRAVLKECFRNFALVLLDLFWFAIRTEDRLRRHVQFDALIEQARRRRTGMVVVTAHLGNWEVLGKAAALAGIPLVSVAAPIANPVLDRMLTWLRRQTGQGVAPRHGALRTLLGALRQGNNAGMVIDQNTHPDAGGVFVEFFGLPVPVSRMAAAIARKTHAPLVLFTCLPDRRGRYTANCRVVHEGPDRDADDVDLTQMLTRRIEEAVRERPGCWLWTYKRWKFVPAGRPFDGYPYYSRNA